MGNKYTPGPWKFSIHEKNISIFSEGWGPIAETVGDCVPKKEKIGNARLIASVPKLLEECKNLLKRIEFLSSNEARHYSKDNSHWINSAKQTIKQAEV